MAAASIGRVLCAAAAVAAPVSAVDCARGTSLCPAQASRPPAGAMQVVLRDSRQEESAQLLQVKAAPRRAHVVDPAVAAQSEELRGTLPVGWLHVPKCGTSFINALVHLPGVCPAVPADLVVSEQTFAQEPGRKFTAIFAESYDIPASCPGMLDLGEDHDGFKYRPHFDETRGNFMTMLRDPEQRTLAAWYDLQLALVFGNFEDVVPPFRAWGGLPDLTVPNITDFATGYAGCATKMLTRQGFRCGDRAPPSDAEVQEAKGRLRSDFSFIGMTDEWALSMCLLSAQFKVPCLPAMMVDTIWWRSDDYAQYDISPLQGIKDPYDRVVFEEGSKIFHENLEKFNVTEEWCRQTCWRDAGIL